jgi:hypothetical protein
MEDMLNKDRDELEQELQRELEEFMVERRKKKLLCFQKTRGGVVKKGDTVKASTPINSPFTPEELVHLIDVSINSNYGADLEGITWALIYGVRESVESLRMEFKQESEKLPRETELRLSHLVGVKQKHNEIFTEYVKRFRDTHSKCYSLTIGE